jgi:hypothetical protein
MTGASAMVVICAMAIGQPVALAQTAVVQPSYSVAGINPDGSTYSGAAAFTPAGQEFTVNWRGSGQGIAIQLGPLAAISQGDASCYVAMAQVQPDGSVQVAWSPGPNSTLGKEVWTPQGDTSAGVAGAYSIAGTNTDGSTYKGQVNVTAKGDKLFDINWATNPPADGVAVQISNIMAIGYSSQSSAWGAAPQCFGGIYAVDPDGTMTGVWGQSGGTSVGAEKLTPAS